MEAALEYLRLPTLLELLVFAGLFVMGLFAYEKFSQSEFYRERKRVVELIDKLPGPPSSPIIGNMHQFHRDPWEALKHGLITATKFGPIFRVWVSFIPVVVLTQPEAVKEVLKTSHPKSFTYKIIHPWLGLSLLTSSGDMWKRKRRMITPAFHFQILRGFADTFVEATRPFMKTLETIADEKKEIEMMQPLTFLTLDIISRCAFGFSLDKHDQGTKSYVEATINASAEMLYHLYWIFIPDFLWNLTPSDARFRQAVRTLHKKADEVIERRKKELAANPNAKEKYHDFLQILLESKDEETKQPLSLKELRDEVNTFLFEGHDTTATGLLWTIYLIAQRPDVYEKIREELNVVLGDRDAPTYDDIGKLKYLSMVIKEALRLYPSVPMIGRQLDEETTILNYHIPANTQVLISLWLLHHNPLVWDKPDEFIPERFDVEESKSQHPYAWVPFSAGPRNCIGQTFALIEEKVVLAMLLKVFRFEVVETHNVRPEPNLILRAKYGIKMRVRRA